MLYQRTKKTNPYHTVWPTYDNADQYYNDFIFTVWCPPKLVEQFTQFLAMQDPGKGNITS